MPWAAQKENRRPSTRCGRAPGLELRALATLASCRSLSVAALEISEQIVASHEGHYEHADSC